MTPAASCPWCGEPDLGGPTCGRCGKSLLVDIAVEPIADERKRFEVARALAALGPPLKGFADVKAALATAEQVVAREASTAVLARINAALQPLGLKAHAALRAPPRQSPIGGRQLVLFAALAVVAAVYWARRPQQGAVQPLPVAAPAKPALRMDKKKVQRAVVQLSCGAQLGAGFFISPDRVLTNAHVLCDDAPEVERPRSSAGPQATREGAARPTSKAMLKVTLPDSRTVLGKVEKRDDWLDYAVVEVGGTTQEPLPLGDSTSLTEGEPIALVGSPQGLSFTWHEGKVSYVGRNHLGVAYLQLDATVNPGNSGGPVVNARGEVVGIVTMKVTTAEGIGLALPIEYVEPPEGAALDRWNAQLQRVRSDDDKASSEAAAQLDRPQLVEAKLMEGRLVVTVLMRAEGTRTAVPVELRQGADVVCTDEIRVREWVSLEQVLKDQQVSPGKQRELRWVLESRTLKGVMGAAGVVSLSRCELGSLKGAAALVLPGGASGHDRIELSRETLRLLQRP